AELRPREGDDRGHASGGSRWWLNGGRRGLGGRRLGGGRRGLVGRGRRGTGGASVGGGLVGRGLRGDRGGPLRGGLVGGGLLLACGTGGELGGRCGGGPLL